jgi:hypothetical protein
VRNTGDGGAQGGIAHAHDGNIDESCCSVGTWGVRAKAVLDAVVNAMHTFDLNHNLHALLARSIVAAELLSKVKLVHGEGGSRRGHREGGK